MTGTENPGHDASASPDPTAPTLVTFERHLRGLDEATERLAHAAHMSWLGAQVPPCPGWSLLDVLAHQGMVHRWARAALVGDEATMRAAAHIETEGRTHVDPIGWVQHGSAAVRTALEEAPEDLAVFTFLKEAPAPRAFWARRQCHETTIHAFDALAAMEERMPLASDAWFGTDLALDGIDELLVGFWQRSRTGPRTAETDRVLVAPSDADLGWLVTSGPERCSVRRFGLKDTDAAYEVDGVVSGPAVDLYLALWNRGGDVHDPGAVLDRWREPGAVTWA